MDKIQILNLIIRNNIGVDSWEREKKQPISVSITLHTDINASGRHDLLGKSIHYGTVSKLVAKFAESTSTSTTTSTSATPRFRSIEALAIGIARICVFDCGAEKVSVTVVKPRGLLHAHAAGVLITRTRTELLEMEKVAVLPPRLEPMPEDVDGTDEIFVKELLLSAILGVNTWERIERQRIIVDFTIYLRHDPSIIMGDVVPKMHNYRRMTKLVTEFVEASSYKTVEALVTKIAELLITVCHAPKVMVRVRKPSALVFADAAGVEIIRDRSSFLTTPTVSASSLPLSTSVVGLISKEESLKSHVSPHVVYLALGSNLGDRVKHIEFGLSELSAKATLLDTSFLYETRPMYVVDQPLFLNAACKISTLLEPEELLSFLKDIEVKCGRNMNGERNGPRPLDLDILFYDNLKYTSERLQIPHPRMAEREFVLRPLCDIAPNLEHPLMFKTCAQILALLLHSEDYKPEPMHRVIGLRGSVFAWSTRTLVMGILNVTPDSFSDGGEHYLVADAVARAREMISEGADIIDVGGQSTRPGAVEVSEEEELQRVLPVIEALRRNMNDGGVTVPISIDTYRSTVARRAVEAGADMINDVTGGTSDPLMLSTVSSLGVPVCLMHMRGTPQTMTQLTDYQGDVMAEIRRALSLQVSSAFKAGVYRWNVVVDPGIGFAKTADQSFELIRDLRKLSCSTGTPTTAVHASSTSSTTFQPQQPSPLLPSLAAGSGWCLEGLPVLVGPSRKRFLEKAVGKSDPRERVWATAAACTAAVAGGSAILRVHDVKEMHDVVLVADKLYKK